MSNLVNNLSFTVSITSTVKLHAQAPVVDEGKFYVQGVARSNRNAHATPPSPLTGMSLDSSNSLHEKAT